MNLYKIWNALIQGLVLWCSIKPTTAPHLFHPNFNVKTTKTRTTSRPPLKPFHPCYAINYFAGLDSIDIKDTQLKRTAELLELNQTRVPMYVNSYTANSCHPENEQIVLISPSRKYVINDENYFDITSHDRGFLDDRERLSDCLKITLKAGEEQKFKNRLDANRCRIYKNPKQKVPVKSDTRLGVRLCPQDVNISCKLNDNFIIINKTDHNPIKR